MAKTKSSTETAALRGGTQSSGVAIPLTKTEAHTKLWHKHDGCHLIADDLHSLIVCMITLADSAFAFKSSEKECAIADIEWQIVLKSRELQEAFK